MTRVAARSAAVLAPPGQLTALELPKMKETGRGGLTSAVLGELRRTGWDYAYHPVQSFTQKERGQPDIFAVRTRDRRILFAELKDATHNPTARQAEVLAILEQLTWPPAGVLAEAFRSMPKVETHVWRPSHWFDGTISRVLA